MFLAELVPTLLVYLTELVLALLTYLTEFALIALVLLAELAPSLVWISTPRHFAPLCLMALALLCLPHPHVA